jgi:nitroreductase
MEIPQNDAKLFDILYTCRSMRRLKPDPVPDDVLVKLVDAALHGPSGSNAQNWTFVVVKDAEQKRNIQAIWRNTWGFYSDTFRKAGARPHEDVSKRDRMGEAGAYMVEHMHEAPAIVFVGVKKDEVFAKVLQNPATLAAAVRHFGALGALKLIAGGSRAGILADAATAYPAVQNLLLAARALGLGAVLTTPQLFVPGAFEALLCTPKTVTLHAAIPVGYPRGKFGPVTRPDPRSVIHWDRYRDRA